MLRATTYLLCFLLISIVSSSIYAQVLTDDGSWQTISYSGSSKTFTIPDNPNISQITFNLNGGDGGTATVRSRLWNPIGTDPVLNTCSSKGGSGAFIKVTFNIGNGTYDIRPGSQIRFIAGGRGSNASSDTYAGSGLDYAGGGGGSAVLALPPGGNSWRILAVAGGGGGAYQGMVAGACVDSKAGQGGRSGTSGGGGGGITGASGGFGGNGGGGTELAGGGGGAFSSGGGVTCIDLNANTTTAGEGHKGYPNGGSKGDSDGCISLSWTNGGFGFGGGGAGSGAGGGGGGYSGGGAGGAASAGGGGGSYRATGGQGTITAGTSTSSPGNGYISYRVILNQSPIARCKGTQYADYTGGSFYVSNSLINNESSDPDGNIASISVSPRYLYCSNIGSNTITLSVTDNDGATSTCTTTLILRDRTKPIARCKNITVKLGANGMVDVPASSLNNFSYDYCGSPLTFLSSRKRFDCSDVGENRVTFTARDKYGNSSSCTATVTVVDDIPPTLNCRNTTVKLNANGQATITPWTIGTTISDVCGIKSRVLSKSSFGCEDVGTQLVTLTVADRNDNVSSCTSEVTIVDEIPPIVVCKDFTLALDANGQGTLNPVDIDGGSSDNCDISTMTVSKSNFGCEDAGSHQVTLRVEDVNGNVNTCTATVTVVDEIEPVALCQNTVVELDINGFGSITEADIDAGSNDACGLSSVVLDKTDFDCDDVNIENSVTLMVTDVNGNSSQCEAFVDVQDNLVPTFSTTGPIVMWPPNHKYQTIDVLQYVDAASIYDNCGGIGLQDIFVLQVSSDEPENGEDDGNTVDDIVIDGSCQSVQLRSERQGHDRANGRVYTITLALNDINGNMGTSTLQVHVPVSKRSSVIDDGENYLVAGCGGSSFARIANNGFKDISIETEVLKEIQIYPNPVRSTFDVHFQAEFSENVQISMINLSGAHVASLFHGQVIANQNYQWQFQAPNELVNGLYLLRITGDQTEKNKKLLFHR